MTGDDMTTEQDKEKGYEVCECGKGVMLHQAGFEVNLHMCSLCKQSVADPDEFFRTCHAVEVLSK